MDVSHVVVELQTELGTIAAETAALHETATVSGGSARRALEGIERSIEVMRRMIRDALDLKALALGTLELDCRPMDLRSVVANVVACMPRSERLRIAMQPAESICVRADEARVARAVEALLRASLTASVAGGPVTLRIDVRDEDVSISALAIRMPYTQAIYEALQPTCEPRAEWDADQVALFVARHAVEAHGGTVGVEYLHEIGLRLYLDLPLPQSA